MKYGLTLLFLQCIGIFTYAQQGSLHGYVSLEDGLPAVMAHVQLKGTAYATTTDTEGYFTFRDLAYGKYQLSVSYIGTRPYLKTVEVSGKENSLRIKLEDHSTELSAATVEGKSKITELKEQPYTVSTIDVKPLKALNLDVNQILNTVSGIRIREKGGLGSDFNFSLNGFSGSQVKFFIDGIPMDYFGSSLSLNNFPVNLISGIEVYKGVVPIQLGSDALGGAVNVVTDQSIKNYLGASYSIGSFNTHRTALIGRFTTGKDFVVKTMAFFNYSDNNYKVEVEVPDPATGKYGNPEQLERFHDAYNSQAVQVEAGVVNKKFADQLFIGLLASENYKDIQVGYNMNKPVGQAFTTEKAIIPSFRFQKSDFFIKDLSAKIVATYKHGEDKRVDTSSRVYNWYGEYTLREFGSTAGEISWDKTLFRFNDDATMISANLEYEIDKRQSLAFNNTYHYYQRVGEDPISYNAVPFSEPNILEKNISGISYNLSSFDSKLKSVAFGKMFYIDALTHNESASDNEELVTIQNTNTYGGFGMASTYFIQPGLQIKASYENTYRLPEVMEMFGNGLLILSSPGLKPEKSQNFNVGILGRKEFGKHHFKAEAGYLYRLPKNLIRNVALGKTSHYENLQSAKARIFEGSIAYNYYELLNIQVNGSYQHIINTQEYKKNGGINYLYGARLPNTPFLFGNATAGLVLKNVRTESDKLSLNWSTLFVEAFYLKWPVYGDKIIGDKKDIPRQVSHSISASYALDNRKYSISLSCTNLFNAQLYDNFGLQKPGRAFNVKLNYFLR